MAKKPGRKPDSGQYKDYLPQASATPEMVTAARELADRKYRGSVGALIREALQEKFERVTKTVDKIEWKPLPVPGYEHRYSISNMGQIRAEPILYEGVLVHIPGKMPRQHSSGYIIISFMLESEREGKQKPRTFPVHRLVMLAFVGKCPDGMEVNHIDGDKTNNCLNNLEYVTHQENIQHYHRVLRPRKKL